MIQNFAASETFKVTQSFPTVLAGTSLPRDQCEHKSTWMYFTLIYSKMNRIIEMWEMETLNFGCTLVLIPQGSPKMMSKEDETFWAAARRICSAWFVEDIQKWASSVDDHAAHEHGNKLAGFSCEEWENLIITLLDGQRFHFERYSNSTATRRIPEETEISR